MKEKSHTESDMQGIQNPTNLNDTFICGSS